MPNTEQIEHWDGEGGEHWAEHADFYDALLRRYADRIMARLDPQPGERVLDIGCGNGALALGIAPHVGEVVGLDISGPMLATAAERAAAAGLSNATFEKGDAQLHALPDASFDAAVSRFGVMFFEDPAAAFANIARMLRPGGRLVFACWQPMFSNAWIMVPAGAVLAHVPLPPMGEPGAPGPFALGDADRVRSLLDGAGFADVELEPVEEPMRYGESVEEAVAFLRNTEMARTLLKDVDEETVGRAWEAVREALAPYAGPDGVSLTGAAWLVTARS
ncbi:MAG TPA: methyltransferase domain-containing protein [Acidimicrobiales bacterium]|nr:methyltransferase domain-containing protein [Acidimicrobiales bacterium]